MKKTEFTPEVSQLAIEIMDRVIQHPCATPFLYPVSEKFREYYEYVRCPIDLSTIRTNLLLNKYSKLNEWRQKLLLIASNTAEFYGKGSFSAILANCLVEVFNKEYDKVFSHSTKKWKEKFDHLNLKFEKILEKHPFQCSKIMTDSLRSIRPAPFSLDPSVNYQNNSISKPINIYQFSFDPFQPTFLSQPTIEDSKQEKEEQINISLYIYQPLYYNERLFKYNRLLDGPQHEEEEPEKEEPEFQELDDDFQDDIPPSPPSPETVNPNVKLRRPKNNKSVVSQKRQKRKYTSKKDYEYYFTSSSEEEPSDSPIEFTQTIEPHDYQLFMYAASMLETQRDAISMAKIIQENEEDIDLSDTTPIVNLKMLKEQTIISLINFTKKRFRELGFVYPTP